MWTDTKLPAADTPAPPASGREPAAGTAEAATEAARSAFGAAVRTLSERRGLRVALIGIALVLLSLWFGTDSAAALPLLAAGLTLIVIGAVGPRLQGRCSLEFGPNGSAFELRTHLGPPGRRALPALPAERPHLVPVPTPEPEDPPDAEVVEAHGETIELDVERLRRLLAAADAKASSV